MVLMTPWQLGGAGWSWLSNGNICNGKPPWPPLFLCAAQPLDGEHCLSSTPPASPHTSSSSQDLGPGGSDSLSSRSQMVVEICWNDFRVAGSPSPRFFMERGTCVLGSTRVPSEFTPKKTLVLWRLLNKSGPHTTGQSYLQFIIVAVIYTIAKGSVQCF